MVGQRGSGTTGDWWRRPPASAVMAAMQTGTDMARFVGGCVRDTLLGRRFTEIDMATVHLPQRTAALLEAAGLPPRLTGFSHGSVSTIAGGVVFDITTLRRDLETDGRRATVGFTDDWAEDAKRRDFTINALFMDADGVVHDPVGGRDDLEAGRVRFVGDPAERVAEDVLRILRFYRFSASLARTPLDDAARRACRNAAPGLGTLPGERIRTEFLKLLEAPGVMTAVMAMDEDGVLDQVLAGRRRIDALARLVGREQHPDPLRRLAVLADDSRIPERLRLSSAQKARHDRIRDERLAPGMSEHDLKARLYRAGPGRFADAVLAGYALDRLADAETDRALALARDWPVPSFPLRGEDLVALGIAPGPRIGAMLRELETRWIGDGLEAGRAACLAWAREAVGRAETGSC